MSFLGAITNEVKGKIPGLSLITNLAKDPLGAIFGKHSQYNFNPWHPPGDWRGPSERKAWEQKRAALGYPPYTNEMGRAFKAWQAQGGKVSTFTWPSPGVLQKTSPVMPGGAIVAPAPNGGFGGAIGTTRKRRKRRRKAAARTRRRRSGVRRMTAKQRRYFGKRRRRARR